MDIPLPSPSDIDMGLKPPTQRHRSNSFPIVEALGCSTPEAQLILAEGRAAVRKRRARGRQNRSVNDESITAFDPREHLQYLNNSAKSPFNRERSTSPHASTRSLHTRQASDASDHSTLTAVPCSPTHGLYTSTITSPTSPLDNYSANLAQFIKAQLKSIPTYQPNTDASAPLSPRSCPDFSCPMRMPSHSSEKSPRRPAEAPKIIQIPPVRPPMRSAFSAWSSTDDEADDDTPPLPHFTRYSTHFDSQASNYASSVLGYYESSTNSSFLFSPEQVDQEEDPDTAKAPVFPNQSTLPGSASGSISDDHDDHDYPSSGLSQPLLTSSSAPTSSPRSTVGSSYFESKRPSFVVPQLRDRVIAALTPPQGKTLTAISPWEGAAIANVHDVFVESQQRIHVDGLSFDMVREFAFPAKVTTPC